MAQSLIPVEAFELRNWLRHAFAVETAESFAPTVAEQELIQRVATEIARRGMTLPAVVMLESSRPLSGLGGQAVRFVEPWFAAVTNAAGLKVLADLLERPGGMDFVVSTLQAINDREGEAPAEPRALPNASCQSAAQQELRPPIETTMAGGDRT